MKDVKINNREKFPIIKLENWRKNQKLERERETKREGERDREKQKKRKRERNPEKEKKTDQTFADYGTEERRGARIRRDSRIKHKDFQY